MRLLSIIEASTITGPASNLLDFATYACPAVDLHLAVFHRPGTSGLFIETARRLSIPVHPIPEARRFDRAVLPRLTALAHELKPDLIQSHAVKSHFLVRISGLHRLAPWIAFHHGYTWPNLRMRGYNQLDRWSLRAARKVVTVSGPFRDDLIRRGISPDHVEVVHNAIDVGAAGPDQSPEEVAAVRAKLGIGYGQRVILIVGRLSREKDHLTLLSALRRLHVEACASDAPSPRLLIIGDGPERPRIEQAIRAFGLADNVTLVGQVPSAAPYYHIANVAVLSSLSEGSPNALLEAMAAHVPVVATRVGGIPEMVSHGHTALLVEPRDEEALAQAITAVLSDDALARRLSHQAYALLEERFSVPVRANRLITIYSSVLPQPREEIAARQSPHDQHSCDRLAVPTIRDSNA